jgi:hypothetical protein
LPETGARAFGHYQEETMKNGKAGLKVRVGIKAGGRAVQHNRRLLAP